MNDSTLGAVIVACLFGFLLAVGLITRSTYLLYFGRCDRAEEPLLYWFIIALYGVFVAAAIYSAVYGPFG